MSAAGNPKNKLKLEPRVKVEEGIEESDTSDTEVKLAKILNTFAKGKKKEDLTFEDEPMDLLSNEEFEEIDKNVPYPTEVRLKRMTKENIHIRSSEMVRYLLAHEFQVRGSTGKTYTVKIGPRIECTCRDHKVRGTHCKHILYVLLHELNVVDMTNKVYVSLFPPDDVLRDIFLKYHPTS